MSLFDATLLGRFVPENRGSLCWYRLECGTSAGFQRGSAARCVGAMSCDNMRQSFEFRNLRPTAVRITSQDIARPRPGAQGALIESRRPDNFSEVCRSHMGHNGILSA